MANLDLDGDGLVREQDLIGFLEGGGGARAPKPRPEARAAPSAALFKRSPMPSYSKFRRSELRHEGLAGGQASEALRVIDAPEEVQYW